MRAGFLQYDPEYLAVEANLDRVESMLDGLDADLLVLPEFFATGYFFKSKADAERVAEPATGGTTLDRLQHWAAEHNTVLVAGFVERDGDRLFNSAAVVTPDAIAGIYRKCHLYYKEKQLFTPGDGFLTLPVADRAGKEYRLGVMVCYDWRFPESARTLALAGAAVIAHPANLVRTECPSAMPIRALENHVFTITANRTGAEESDGETLTFIGQSLICDPMGKTLASASATESCLSVTQFDPAAALDRRITAFNDVLGDRRPEVYVG